MTNLAGTQMPGMPSGYKYVWWYDDNAERINNGGAISEQALTFEDAQAKLAKTITADKDRMSRTNRPGYWVASTWFISVDDKARADYPDHTDYVEAYDKLVLENQIT